MNDRASPRTGALLTVDLAALCDNWHTLQEHLRTTRCAAVVKADAYGLGAGPVAQALHQTGCRHFFVAHVDEAIALRPALPGNAAIYVLHGAPPGAEQDFLVHGLIPVLNTLPQVQAWRSLAARNREALPALLQVDTGMSRLGLSLAELEALVRDPAGLAGIDLRYLMSHLACAEDPADLLNAHQLERFHAARRLLPEVPASFANSSGIFLGPAYHFDLARPGAALYGVAPVAGQPNPMRPVIRLQGKVVQTRSIPAGTPVGYSHTWTAPRPSRLATVSVGYADGYLRSLSNHGHAFHAAPPSPWWATFPWTP